MAAGSSSLYQIAVRLTMISNHGGVLAALAHDLLHVHHGINQATAASNRFRTAIVGAATAFIGTGLLGYMGRVIEKGAEFARVADRMRLAGWSEHKIEEATRNAFAIARRYPSLNAGLIMEMQREMAPVLGSREEAMHLAGPLARLMRVLQIQHGPEATHAIHGEVVAAVRAGELTANTLTDKRFLHFMNMMVPAINAWGGLITPQDYAQAFKYARAAGLNMSDRFMTQILPTIMQEMGASSAGTSFMSAFQAAIGGRMRLHSLNAFADLGLIDRSKIAPDNLTPEGRIRRMQPGLIVDSQLFMSDPDIWAHKYLAPALIAKGIMKQEDYDVLKSGDLHSEAGKRARQAITQQLAILFRDRTAQGLMDLLLLQFRKLQRDSRLVGEGLGLEDSQRIVGLNYGMAKAGVIGSWETLNEALALPNMAAATEGLNTLSAGLRKITDVVRGMDPETVKDIFIGTAVGLTALVGAGLVALIGAIGGWPFIIGAAIVAGLTVAGLYVWRHREEWTAKVQEGMLGAAQWLAQDYHWLTWPVILAQKVHGLIHDSMVALANTIGEGLKGLPAHLVDDIGTMVQGIAAEIGKQLASIGKWLGSFVPSFGGSGPAAPSLQSPDDLMLQPQNWVPPARRERLVPIRHAIQIDGHKLGEAVAYYIAVGATHVQSAAQYDGTMAHAPVDLQFA